VLVHLGGDNQAQPIAPEMFANHLPSIIYRTGNALKFQLVLTQKDLNTFANTVRKSGCRFLGRGQFGRGATKASSLGHRKPLGAVDGPERQRWR
jgi:hypothetical protein